MRAVVIRGFGEKAGVDFGRVHQELIERRRCVFPRPESEPWRGVSGGPIFSDEEAGGLVGVITDASRVYENELRGLVGRVLLEPSVLHAGRDRPGGSRCEP